MLNMLFYPLAFVFASQFLVVALIFWIWMLVDCIKSDLRDNDKLIWILIILFSYVIGALVYLIFVKLNKNYRGSGKMKKKDVKKLYRSKKSRIIAGVCGGLGDYFKVDPTIIRLIWILFVLVWGAGILAYVLAWIIIPER
ncbi:MAG: PspC domain-containing protein [Nanoarchaeota archaeon]|nr:PspC domain-containing protein [Nanoarchaeota archaeon]